DVSGGPRRVQEEQGQGRRAAGRAQGREGSGPQGDLGPGGGAGRERFGGGGAGEGRGEDGRGDREGQVRGGARAAEESQDGGGGADAVAQPIRDRVRPVDAPKQPGAEEGMSRLLKAKQKARGEMEDGS